MKFQEGGAEEIEGVLRGWALGEDGWSRRPDGTAQCVYPAGPRARAICTPFNSVIRGLGADRLECTTISRWRLCVPPPPRTDR